MIRHLPYFYLLLLPRREAGQSGLAPGYQNSPTISLFKRVPLISRSSIYCSAGGGLVHVLLHAGCVIRFQLLDLRLLVGSEQLI